MCYITLHRVQKRYLNLHSSKISDLFKYTGIRVHGCPSTRVFTWNFIVRALAPFQIETRVLVLFVSRVMETSRLQSIKQHWLFTHRDIRISVFSILISAMTRVRHGVTVTSTPKPISSGGGKRWSKAYTFCRPFVIVRYRRIGNIIVNIINSKTKKIRTVDVYEKQWSHTGCHIDG